MISFTKYRVIIVSITALVVLVTLAASYHLLDFPNVSLGRQHPPPPPPPPHHHPPHRPPHKVPEGPPTTPEKLQEQEKPQQKEEKMTPEQQHAFIEEQRNKPHLPHPAELYSLKRVRKVPEKVTSTIFMFRGDFSSDLYDLFAIQKRATRYCDKDTTVDGCDVKLAKNYKWGTLSEKLFDSLELMCKAPEKTDFYVKIDDDLIMPESKLEDAMRTMAATDCQVAGGIAVDYGFYWAVGQIYIFKRAVLEKICPQLPVTNIFHSSEDISFGSLLNTTDKSMFCNLHKPENHWHKKYKDRRVEIKYYIQHNERR
ncbi:hypothetical protein GGI11_000850 [Coemansia sp. RSA 2049]|nr:hypothetical protein H4217_005587 [Coemansia sp. RSA 1939]KAJ2524400.1 hypothetical protein GGI11_000850 [Coemansia sp. RSA 2049]